MNVSDSDLKSMSPRKTRMSTNLSIRSGLDELRTERKILRFLVEHSIRQKKDMKKEEQNWIQTCESMTTFNEYFQEMVPKAQSEMNIVDILINPTEE